MKTLNMVHIRKKNILCIYIHEYKYSDVGLTLNEF